MRYRANLLCMIGLFTLVVNPALAEDAKIDDSEIELSVPETPAANVIGIASNEVSRPSSAKEFATSMINGIDGNGNNQTGFAIEASPYMLLYGKDTTLEEYKTDKSVKFMSRTQFSFATTKGTSEDDKSIKYALGFRFTPWDKGDPRLDKKLTECLRTEVGKVNIDPKLKGYEGDNIDPTLTIDKILEERDKLKLKAAYEVNPQEKQFLKRQVEELENQRKFLTGKGTEEINREIKENVESCRNEAKKRLWNESSWTLGFAPTFISTSGNTNDIESSGLALWSSLALRLGKVGQLIMHTRYLNGEEVPDPDIQGQFFEQNSYRFGGRIRFGNPEFNFNIETSYTYFDKKGGRENDETLKYSSSLEYKVAKDMWLTLNAGTETGNNTGNNAFIIGNLKWAFSPEPTIKLK